jgi:hypothetical protein
MRAATLLPTVHLFVCANRRAEDSPLGAGCSAVGDAVYDRFKEEVARRGAYRDVWVTKTGCLGICPAHGCTVALYSRQPLQPRQRIVAEVEAADAPALFASALGAATVQGGAESPTWEELDALLGSMEELQTGKVLDLARRLKPGLTLEDVRNPHDFPELEDPDWHYEDGVLTGIQSVRTALAALRTHEQHGRGR